MLRRIGSREFYFSRQVAVMAIVNRTPDSFFDNGSTFALDRAVNAENGDRSLLSARAGERDVNIAFGVNGRDGDGVDSGGQQVGDFLFLRSKARFHVLIIGDQLLLCAHIGYG